MKIDLHIHTRDGSDGNLTVEEVFEEAKRRGIDLISITDHDSIACQASAVALAQKHGMHYISGVELNVTFPTPEGKPISLDFLGYGYDIADKTLADKLEVMRRHREERAREILKKLNAEFARADRAALTDEDMSRIQASADGALGRPHIANYLIARGIVADKKEAFDKYLTKCDAPKYPLSLEEASDLIRNAGGTLIHAHPNDPNGTSLIKITPDLDKQAQIIERYMLEYIDGIECWHSRHDDRTIGHYVNFTREHGLMATGGSDCHQKPIIIGEVVIPSWVADQFIPSLAANYIKGGNTDK